MRIRCWALIALLPLTGAAGATDLYSRGASWPALASDRSARQVGDALTIVVYESASATNASSTSSKKSNAVSGGVNAGHFDKSAGLQFGGSSQGLGSTGRSGQMVAQISAVVDEVLPNGDLRVSGQQELHINGERTHIRVKGRVRLADISSANAVLSSRLADAAIDYDGTGFVSRSGKPGVVTRIFNWLGLL